MVRIFGKDLRLPRFGVNLTDGKWFEKQARKVFDEVDVDRDGQLDNKEVYIGLLKLYDLVNNKLPCHIKVPTLQDITYLLDKYDVNGNRRLEFPEFLQCCKGLIGHKKDWKDSLFLKIAIAVTLKTIGFPYLAGALKSGIAALGLAEVQGVPTSVLTYALEAVAKQVS